MESSGANKGFFQQQPVLKNQLYDDVVLQRVIKCAFTQICSDDIP
jgi:hypothetical protein